MGKGKSPNRWKGCVVGLLGGAAGTFAMNQYWQIVVSTRGKDPRQETSESGPHELDDISLVGEHHEEGESSTAALGRELTSAVADKKPTRQTQELLSNEIHWTYGSLQGAVYGLLRGGASTPLDPLGGIIYGAALWLFGSELAVPLLGLSSGPSTQTTAGHAYGLGAHMVYGLVASTVTQALYSIGE